MVSWNGVRVLVTGANGFMASHLTEALLSQGAEVSVVVRYVSAGSGPAALTHLRSHRDRLHRILRLDLATPDAAEAIAELSPEVIFHLAADAWVPRSFELPREVVQNNVGSTLQVLHGARSCERLQRVVITSSSEIYGTAQTSRIAEDHPLEPTSPYAASKVACDRLAAAWRETFGIPVAIIRPFNTFGPRHVYDVIPKFVRLALAGEPLTVHGSGEQSRDFTYVDDMVRAFLAMGSDPAAVGRVVNFGTGEATSIATVARRIVELAESTSEIIHDERRTAEVDRLTCDPSLAHELFGWKAEVSLVEGLRRHIAWARQHALSARGTGR
ncbi:MAG: GDP-mannose 4,6-dehydratase [Myxococcota bacterium]